LPQKRAYETVLWDALIADCCDPIGLYFGTRSGQLFASRDEGKNWHKILEGLPAILCVRCALVECAAGDIRTTFPKQPSTTSSPSKDSKTKRKPNPTRPMKRKR
jgi:hypothetical protein